MNLSSAILLLANAVPLVGVVFWQWDVVLVLALFWIENLIIGAFNLIKMAWVSARERAFSGLFLMAFFIIHFGAFCAAHGLLLGSLLDQQVDPETSFGPQAESIPSLFVDAAQMLVHFITTLAPAIWMGLSALLLSHLVSFIDNFLLRGEWHQTSVNQLMAKPYKQIIVMHTGLIIGAVLLQKLGSPVWLLALLVLLKMAVDFAQFRHRHRQLVKETVKEI